MGLEIERKFLVDQEKWNKAEKGKGHLYRQGYIVKDDQKTIRVRMSDTEAYITIKGSLSGIVRKEFEYPVPLEDAKILLDEFAVSAVTKIRHAVTFNNKLWEVDEFLEDNEGLVLAEIELDDETEAFDIPDWVTVEVTADLRYYSSNLSVHPYKSWPLG